MRQSIEIAAGSSEDTAAVGARLAKSLPSLVDSPAIAYLEGELGSGKTTLARGVLRGLGVNDVVRSPTYTLLERYETGEVVVVHLDLYRLQEAAELEQLGLRELHRARHVWLIEWPERGAHRLPAADVVVQLSAGAKQHRIRLRAGSALGALWLERYAGS